MIFLRMSDHAEILGCNKENIILGDEETKRKNNIALGFNYKFNGFEYHEEEVKTKMIPKSDKELFQNHDFFLLETEHSSIMFQDIQQESVFFVLNSEDEIQPTKITELTEDDTILLYDVDTEDYIYSEIERISFIEWSPEFDETFSNYIIHSTNGLIINKFMIA